MIVLDTNVISEFTRALVSDRVTAWLAGQDPAELHTTTITEAELLVGVAALPTGKRRTELMRETSALLSRFGSRILPFDRDAAQAFALVVLQRKAAGLATDTADCQIAAIARLHGASVATRNVGDFEHAGIQIINPWTA